MLLTVASAFPRRGLIALCRRRLRVTLGARLGLAATLGICVVAIAFGLSAHDSDPRAGLGGLVIAALRWSLWLGAGPLALAAANDLAARDRHDGVEALARSRGCTPAELAGARLLAAMFQTTSRVAFPILLLTVLFGVVSGQSELWILLLPLLLYAVIFGVVLGLFAAICGLVGRAYGRSLLLLIVLLPWTLADLYGAPAAYSLPGALDAMLSLLLGLTNTLGALT